jgi:ABC-2 type transport system permease protein
MSRTVSINTESARQARDNRLGLGKSIQDAFTIARRDVIRMKRQPDLILMGAMTGIFFLVLFNYVFGNVISSSTGVNYTQFLVPGIIVLTALFGSNQTGLALAEDLNNGAIDRFRSLPMSQIAVITGRTLSDILRNLISILMLIAVAYLMGFRFPSLIAFIGSVLLGIGIGYAFSWINAMFGAGLDSFEAVQMIGMFWLFPLMFVSNVFTPTEGMNDTLQFLADNSPISVTSEAIRALSIGAIDTTAIFYSLVWMIGLTIIFIPLSVRAYQRRMKQ